MTQFERQGSEFVTTTNYVGVSERPPMVDVVEYRHLMAAETAWA